MLLMIAMDRKLQRELPMYHEDFPLERRIYAACQLK